MRSMLFRMILVAVVSATAGIPAVAGQGANERAHARMQTATAEEQTPIAVYKVAHDHAVGSGDGELRITAAGIEYRGASAREAEHSRVWRDQDIKRIEITEREITVVAYEANRVVVLPRHVPFVKDAKSVGLGSERRYEFHLEEGKVTPEVVRVLLSRIERPVATTVEPSAAADSTELLFEIPVFHRHVSGGESGSLRVYSHHVAFEAERQDRSHYWRYTDIRDISRLGRFGFEIATYESASGTDGKSYVFDLKRPMTEAEYETIWKQMYEPSPPHLEH